MTEPTNLVKTQPDETHLYSATVESGHFKTIFLIYMDDLPISSATAVHFAITVRAESGKTIDSGTLNLWMGYKGADRYCDTYYTASTIGDSWTRIETTGTIPAGMTANRLGITLYKTASLYMTNLTVYPLTGGRIVRARGATAGYISKAKEATVLYTPSKSARQVRVILLDETGSSIYDIQSVAIVADAEELQGKVAAQESSIQTIQSDMTTVQSGLSGLNVRLASMQTELAGVSAGDVLYQVPYTVSDGKATFTAAVYKSGVECHTSYDPSCFTWYLKSEAGTVKIGTGYSVTVNVGDVGYGGFVVGVFETQ